MTREKYSFIFPALLIALIVIGFILVALFPTLPYSFYLAYGLGGGAIVLVIDRVTRRTVKGPLTDERVRGTSENAAWVSYRITLVAVIVGGTILIYAFPSIQGLRLLGIGAVFSVALQSLIYGITLGLVRSKK